MTSASTPSAASAPIASPPISAGPVFLVLLTPATVNGQPRVKGAVIQVAAGQADSLIAAGHARRASEIDRRIAGV